MKAKMLRPDAKGRITLGALAEGVSGFLITETNDHKILLEPYSEVPSNELWLFDNQEALSQVRRGLKDVKTGEVFKKGTFKQYIDDEID